jgi:hypothetical protein
MGGICTCDENSEHLIDIRESLARQNKEGDATVLEQIHLTEEDEDAFIKANEDFI